MSRIQDALRLGDEACERGWPSALAALAVALLCLAVPMWGPSRRLVDLWLNADSYGHGVLIVPVMLYLFWLQRHDYLRLTPVPSFVGLVAMAGAMALWFIGRVLGIVMIEQLALVASLIATTWAILGARVAWRAFPVLVYLMCAVPVWTYLNPILQDHTAIASAAIVRKLGVPIYLEGLYMTIPDGRFVVADVCSGLRYLLAALSLGGFYALLNLDTWWSRLVLIASSLVVSIVFNWVRVVGIVAVGHYTQMQSSLVHQHNTYGWILFLFVVVAILVLGRMLERLEGGDRAVARSARISPQPQPARTRFGVMALLVGALGIAPAAFSSAWLRPPEGPIAFALTSMAQAAGWQVRSGTEHPWHPLFSGMDAAATVSFEHAGHGAPVELFVAYYATQRQDAEAVNDTNKSYDPAVWRRIEMRAVPDRVQIGDNAIAAEFVIQRVDGATRRLVWRTYWVNDNFVTGTFAAKKQQLKALLSGQRAAAAVLLSTRIDGTDEQARLRLRAFADAALVTLQQRLRRLSGGTLAP